MSIFIVKVFLYARGNAKLGKGVVLCTIFVTVWQYGRYPNPLSAESISYDLPKTPAGHWRIYYLCQCIDICQL